MSFGGFGGGGFGQNNTQQQSTGFGGFGATNNTTTGTLPLFSASLHSTTRRCRLFLAGACFPIDADD